MDCEKFESTMIDELYGELDELTSAAAKRHVAGCARCAAMLSGLRATREVATLPLVEPPVDLESRILAAAKEAQKVVPIASRFSRVVSWAGSWAMRPQTAMAALFLLMIGSSALLLKSRAHKSEGVAMTVTEQGAPAPATDLPEGEKALDTKQAQNAHGALARGRADQPPALASAAPPPPEAVATPTVAAATTATAMATSAPMGYGLGGGAGTGGSAGRDEAQRELKGGLAMNSEGDLNGQGGAVNAGPVAGSPKPKASPPSAPGARAQTAPSDPYADSWGADGKKNEAAKDDKPAASSDAAAAAYAARNYAEAARLYDEQAKRGDKRAALLAARSVRELSGCGAAVSRFDALGSSAWGSDVGYDSTLEAGYCYRAVGNTEMARSRFSRLLTVPTHAQRAQVALDSLSAVASRKSAAKPAAPPAATQAPANAAPAQPQSQQPAKAVDQSGF